MLTATLVLTETEARGVPIDDTLTLPFDLRQRSRLVARLCSGREILLKLPRGTRLRHDTLLSTSEGTTIQVCAAPEELSVVTHDDPLRLLRAAYHLGNRHVPLQIEAGSLAYRHDHVLDDMLRGLGFAPHAALLPFEPEQGAYAHGEGHSHGEHGHHPHSHHEDDS